MPADASTALLVRVKRTFMPLGWGMSMIEPSSKSTLAYNAIKAAILDGKLRGGEWINVRAWANALGISDTPVKFALMALQAEGLVEAHARQGFVVPDFNEISLRDLFDIRSELYLMATRGAHPRRSDSERLLSAPGLADLQFATERLFVEIALSSGRSELAAQIERINNRLRLIHRFKVDLISDLADEFLRMAKAWRAADLAALEAEVIAFTGRRQDVVPEIVARSHQRAG